MRILRNPADAEEVLQETFVRVWSRAETYDALLGSPAAWVIRIARNRAIDLLRARRARADIAVERAAHAGDDAPRSVEPTQRDTPETALEGRTIAAVVRTALATLTPAQRELIEAAFFEGSLTPSSRTGSGCRWNGKDAHTHGPGSDPWPTGAGHMIPAELEALVLADRSARSTLTSGWNCRLVSTR